MEYALSLLDMHDHSEYDLRQKLQRREVKGAMQDAVVAQLQDYGLLDAQRYAEAVYDAWLRKRVYGRQHLRAELLKKHVEPQYVRLRRWRSRKSVRMGNTTRRPRKAWRRWVATWPPVALGTRY